jgi:undecaprenyl-phosphate 4-deoxy-4-formamido-L-arabinose transferase
MTTSLPDISVIIPVFNESPNIRELYDGVIAALEPLEKTFEVVFIDDGSSDGSFEILKELRAADARLRIVKLSRNFGQTPALYAGFANARGRIVAHLDADLQYPPREMGKLIRKLDEGYDVVQGWRENRRDPWSRRAVSKALNIVVSRLIGTEMHDLGCGLKVFNRETVDRLNQIRHHARYLPAEYIWMGARIAEVKIEHHRRAKGVSKYNLIKLMHLNFSLITAISNVPIRLIGASGLLFVLTGSLLGAAAITGRLITGAVSTVTAIAALFFFLSGVQLLAAEVVCEYVGRIYAEVQDKPLFIVKEIIE